MPQTLQTIEMREPGGPGVLEPGERTMPEPGAREVLIEVAAAGVNGPDLLQRRGHYPPPPGASDLLGLEVSGRVAAVGSSVDRWRVDDAVCALANGGGYASHVVVDAEHCLGVPEGVELVDAAGLPETFFTVWSNCFLHARPDAGALFLVHGGAGGIGSTAVQLGTALGLRTFTTCSADDMGFCTGIGAERAIDYAAEDFVGVVREAGGADLVLDILGGDYIARNVKAASPDARLVQLAFNRGSKVEIDLMPIMLKRLVYTGSTLRSRPSAFKAEVARDLEREAWPMFARGALRTLTHAVLPFSRVREAHELMEAGGHRGKILLVPG